MTECYSAVFLYNVVRQFVNVFLVFLVFLVQAAPKVGQIMQQFQRKVVEKTKRPWVSNIADGVSYLDYVTVAVAVAIYTVAV